MRRSLSTFLTVAIAALLSVTLAIPASADVTPGKPLPVDPRFKYGLDYYYREIFDASGVNGTDKPPGWKPSPVSPAVNPSQTGGSWYLNNVKQARTAVPAGTNKPLTGKIFLPGEPLPSGFPGGTVVKPPSVFKPVAPFTGGSLFGGSALFGKLLGTSGFGLGGVTQSPSNTKDIAASQGVAAGCLSDPKTCSAGDMSKWFAIANCGHTSTCKSIGAKDESGTPITSDGDWWKDTAIPFLSDLWAKLTGQTDAAPVAIGQHIEANSNGCMQTITVEDRGSNNITLHVSSEIIKGRPASYYAGQLAWDQGCTGAALTTLSQSQMARAQSVCIDSKGLPANSLGTAYGTSPQPGNVNAFDPSTGQNKVGLCNNDDANKPTTLMYFRVYNDQTQAYFDNNPSVMVGTRYTQWVNPDPNKDTTDSTTVTTTVDCGAPNGQTMTYAETVKKVAAYSAPSCPPGFDPIRADVKTSDGTVANQPVASAAVDPATVAKYPLCDQRSGPGCSLWVALDGTACKSTRTECTVWSDVQARQPSRVACKWGTYTMPISDCYGIAEGYKTESGLVLDPKSGAWVAVDTNGNPQPVSPQPWNPTNPNPVVGATPGTTPATPPNAAGSFPGSGTNPSNNCDSPSWSWNPVEWVHNPVVCALKDAFVPKQDIQAMSNALAASAKTTVPIAWISNPIIGPSGGGCPNWVVNVGPVHQNVVCNSSFTAAILGSRGPMFGIVASAMLWPLIRGIWYALIPIVRVTPTGSK